MAMTDFKANWAYNFISEKSLEEIVDIYNASGPWQWQQRESYMFGHYINTRPGAGLHIRIHEYPQAFFGTDRQEEGFSALIQIESDSVFLKLDVDAIFLRLLQRINATEVREIEPYD